MRDKIFSPLIAAGIWQVHLKRSQPPVSALDDVQIMSALLRDGVCR